MFRGFEFFVFLVPHGAIRYLVGPLFRVLWLLCRPCKMHTLISQPSAPCPIAFVGEAPAASGKADAGHATVSRMRSNPAVTFIFDLHRKPNFLASPWHRGS